jgi:nucleoside phosphorylase
LSTRAAIHTPGIIVALAAEAAVLASRAKPEHITTLADGAALWLSGMGPAAATRAAEALADAGAVALAVFGVAGALSAHLRNGALFCPERVLDENGDVYAADPAWRESIQQKLTKNTVPLHTEGALLSVASPLLTTAAKTAAHARHEALAVDMESAAVAAVARQRSLPFVVLRAIVDEAADAIPDALNGSVDAFGHPRARHLIAALGRHPTLIGELPRLYLRMQRATQALRTAVGATGPTMGWPR